MYLNTFKDKNGESLGATFVALLQLSILCLVLILISIISKDFNTMVFSSFLNNPHYKLWKILLAVSVLGFNFYRYFTKKRYNTLKAKWMMEDSNTKYKNGLIIAWFTIIVLACGIGFAIIRQKMYI